MSTAIGCDITKGKSPESGPMARGLELASEVIVLVMACVSPWAIGAVDARAELGLAFGLVALSVIHTITGWKSDRRRHLVCWPSLALAGLGLLALAQATPLPVAVLKRVAPATYNARSRLVPSGPQRVCGDSRPAVPPPPTAVSLDPDATVHIAAQLAAVWALFQVTLGLGRGYATTRRFALAIAGNATLIALFSLIQSLTWNGKIYGVRPTPIKDGWFTGGPFVCHNHLAAYLNLGLGFALGFLLLPRQRGRDVPYPGAARSWMYHASFGAAYAASSIVVGILGSHSRSGFLAMMAATAFTVVMLRPRALRLGGGLGALLLLTSLFLVVLGSASPFHRLATILDSSSNGYTTRFDLWRDVVQAWQDHPFWGMGLGSFPAAAAPYLSQEHRVFFSHAENEYLQILTEAGVVGLVLVLIALAAVSRLARRAFVAVRSRNDRAVVSGLIFGGLTLAIQSVSDFPLHIPGVVAPGVVLVAHLCRLGIEADDRMPLPRPAPPRTSVVGSALAGLGMIGLSLAVLVHEFDLARAEILVVRAGIPVPGAQMPSIGAEDLSRPDLKRRREALAEALRLRPDWAEGHYRLGITLLGLYESIASEWIGEAEATPATRSPSATATWLHAVVHSATAEQLAESGDLIEHEPIRRFLVPAARSFLEARRSCPVLAHPHVRLASLDYLLERGEPTAIHIERALQQAGADGRMLELAAQVAVQAGDLSLAARCWKRALEVEVDEEGWKRVADAAGAVLSPAKILKDVLPTGGGKDPLRFADRLYSAPEDWEIRTRFLREAQERAPRDTDLTPTERLWLEAQARARLSERERAKALMEATLAREPIRTDWREEFAAWLIGWGEPGEARHQALIGLQLSPGHPGLRRTLRAAVDAFARGDYSPSDRSKVSK